MLRSVGALTFGAFADRYGCKWPMIVALGLFVILELASGFCQTLPQFLAVRSLYGIAMGGKKIPKNSSLVFSAVTYIVQACMDRLPAQHCQISLTTREESFLGYIKTGTLLATYLPVYFTEPWFQRLVMAGGASSGSALFLRCLSWFSVGICPKHATSRH